MLEQTIFTKVIKNVKLGGLGRETQRCIKRGVGEQALKVRAAEFASLKLENI
jgi:hypothetical protein